MNGVTAKQFSKALSAALSKLEPLGEEDVERIKRNPGMNFFQKALLIHRIRKNL